MLSPYELVYHNEKPDPVLGLPPYGMRITGLGGYAPGKAITNDGLAHQLSARGQLMHQLSNGPLSRGYDWVPMPDEALESTETSDEWIVKRTGFWRRHLGRPGEATSDIAVAAVRQALDTAGISAHQLDFLICGTVTPDHLYSPSTAAVILRKLGVTAVEYNGIGQPTGIRKNTFTVDVGSACTTFGAAFRLAYGLSRSGQARRGVIIGAEELDLADNEYDRSTAVLFGRAASAWVVEAVPRHQDAFCPDWFLAGTEATFSDKIICKVGGSALPYTPEIMKEIIRRPWNRPDKLWQDGGFVLEFMVRFMADVCLPETLEKARLRWSDINHAFLHQANSRLIARIVDRLGKREGANKLPIFHDTGKYFSNTSSASIPLGVWYVQKLDWLRRIQAAKKDREPRLIMNQGDGCLFSGFGGGVTWVNWIGQWTGLTALPLDIQNRLEAAQLQTI